MAIDKFENEYRFLSNFYPVEITYEGMTFRSVEHAFQAAKTMDLSIRHSISMLATPSHAKAAGKTVLLRDNWDKIKVRVMKELVTLKFAQYPSLRRQLMATEQQELIEGNWWGDRFWGVCNGVGENWLGKILMELRDQLR